MAPRLGNASVARHLTTFAVLSVLAGVLTGCTGAGPTEPGPTASTQGTTASTPTEPAPVPTPSPTPGPEADGGDEKPAATSVAFTGSGVGDVLDGTPDALAPLEELLGPADRFEDSWFADCGAPWIAAAWWGPMLVTFNEGALFGWQVDGRGTLPANVALPHDIHVGDPFSQVTALPGAAAPEFFDNYQVFTVSLDGVQWWADDDEPQSPVTVIGHSIVGCG